MVGGAGFELAPKSSQYSTAALSYMQGQATGISPQQSSWLYCGAQQRDLAHL